jgi:hypothetical protein
MDPTNDNATGQGGAGDTVCDSTDNRNPTPLRFAAQSKHINPHSKRAHVLRVFLERGDRGLSCFEAVELARDYVLRTSVSEIRRFHGIEFHKQYEHFQNAGGSRTDYVRYSLTPEGAAKARELLRAA